MKVFVDLSRTQLGKQFAIYDTIVDRFEVFQGNQTWGNDLDFISDYDGTALERYMALIPLYYKKSKKYGANPLPSSSKLSGIEIAARFVEERRNDYIDGCGSYDLTTGMTEYPGDGSQYVYELEEIIEGIRAIGVLEEPDVYSLDGQLKEAEYNINVKADFIEATVNQVAKANDASDHWRAHVGSLLAVIQYMTEVTGEWPDDEDAAMIAHINSEYESSNA